MNSDEQIINLSENIAVSSELVTGKDPLTIAVNGLQDWALRGSNPRPSPCKGGTEVLVRALSR